MELLSALCLMPTTWPALRSVPLDIARRSGMKTNYSVRLPEYAAPAVRVITSSGVDKETIGPEQGLVHVDQHGRAGKRVQPLPSAKTLLHLMEYRITGVRAVVHTHSIAGALLSRAGRSIRISEVVELETLKGPGRGGDAWPRICAVGLPNSQVMRALVVPILSRISDGNDDTMGFCWPRHGLHIWSRGQNHVEGGKLVLHCERGARTYGRAFMYLTRMRRSRTRTRSGVFSTSA